MAAPGIDQAALDSLFTTALETAIARVEKDGAFQPLLFELRAGGGVQAVAVLDPGRIAGRQAVLDRLVTLLRPRARDGTIAGAAIVTHEPADSAIAVRLRAANYAADVAVPYRIDTYGRLRRYRALRIGRYAARAVDNEIFG